MVVSVSVFLIMMLLGKRQLIFMAVLAMSSVAMIHRDDLWHTAAVTQEAACHSKHLRSEHCKSAEHK